MASPHFRRQDSLEGILDFSLPPLSDPGDRANAERRFYQIINHFRSEDHGQDTYDRVELVSSTLQNCQQYRLERRGQGTAFDDDGQPLAGQRFGSDKKLNESKQAALNILRMFSDGAAYLIDGANIDCPQNALTLSVELHRLFGDFEIFFQPDDTVRYQYHIRTFAQEAIDDIPITRTLTGESNIDLPSPQLLAIHCAIAHILHLSGAGDYIDRILRDADDYGIRRDGSTELCCLLELRLNNWVGRQADRGMAMV
ncbi:hypothetical protein NXS19_012259 [Fusarium pseudograminearum]|nr:hypothetical protein NXS19_012259 [Fusarium pseudograminearum]